MHRSQKIFDVIRKNKLIALISPENPDDCIKAFEIFNPLGIVLEVAFRTKAAIDSVRELFRQYPEANLLAGTVLTAEQAEICIDLGIGGVVSPDYFPDVVEICVNNDIMCIPGGLGNVGIQLFQKAKLYGCTPEELRVKRPWQWIHKLFPAVTSTANFCGLGKSWKGPYPGLQIIYTGGITFRNLSKLFHLDPDGIICASALTRELQDRRLLEKDAVKWKKLISTPEKQ